MCRHPWPLEVIGDLVSVTKPGGKLTGSDLELAALVLHEANFLVEVPVARMVEPRPGLDSIPTVS